MGSFTRNGRNQHPERRRRAFGKGLRGLLNTGLLGYEPLERRTLLASNLAVSSVTPAAGATETEIPSNVVVTFNEPVNFSTVTAADLAFTTVPAGVTSVQIGSPIALGNPTEPTQVEFPISYTPVAGGSVNGTYGLSVSGSIVGADGTTIQPFTSTYTVNDTSGPHVVATTVSGRIVTVQFDEPLSASLNDNTIYVAYTTPQGTTVNLDSDPRFKLSYNSLTNTAVLDYSGLDQAEFPSGANYYIVVQGMDENADGTFEPGVSDLNGYRLDGNFYGTFPSGYNASISGPETIYSDHNFVEPLGALTPTAPQVSTLTMAAQDETGVAGQQNTDNRAPVFVGQVVSSFPGSVSGITIEAEFSGLHGGQTTLAPQNGRGSTGTYDVETTTNAAGSFEIASPFLPEGYQTVQVVAIGQPDSPPLPGLSSSYEDAFRVDVTPPEIVAATINPVSPSAGVALPLGTTYTPLASLSTLSLDVVDPASPETGPLATPTTVSLPALNPATASNVSNYTLKDLDLPVGEQDKSSFITAATFVPTDDGYVNAPNRTSAAEGYFGRIDLTFAPGLPAGHYQLIAHTSEGNFGGLTDAAGNPLNESRVPGEGGSDFYISFQIQSSPVYIESVSANATNASGNTLLPYSYYEINPRAGDDASAPPTTFYVDVSNPLNPNTINNDSIQLIGTANTSGGAPDGDFGTFGEGGLGSSGTGFSRFDPTGTTVTLTTGPSGPDTRLVLALPAGTVLPADHYRFYIPNTGSEAISDIYGNQLDGEFLGFPAASSQTDANGNPLYESLMPNGQYRDYDMSGDGTAGGAFVAGFEVVPSGNIIYAQASYNVVPTDPNTTPDGSVQHPYPVLAPQAVANSVNGGNLNSPINYTDFSEANDKADIGAFAPSAFYAASQLAANGPVVIVALPSINQKTFVLQAPAGGNGSASVPFDTTLVFDAGTTLKLDNASLFVQNQGSALQTLGASSGNAPVTFTSINDNTVGANPNGASGSATPQSGDWGGIVFRNFDQAVPGRTTTTFPVDGTLAGPDGTRAVSGADDSLSLMAFTNIRYAGGAVPSTSGPSYDAITLYNSRPAIVQDSITNSGSQAASSGTGGTGGAAISGDLDSFREDDTRRGPLLRMDTFSNDALDGIEVRPNASGTIQATNAEPYPANPVTLGGAQNYTFDAPLPYLILDPLHVGEEELVGTNDQTTPFTNRLYIQPGVLVKFQSGAGIDVTTQGASLNIGDRTYISGFDSDATVDPTTGLPTSTYGPDLANGQPNPAFKAEPEDDAFAVFTSLYDNAATTSYTDPTTGLVTTIVPASSYTSVPTTTTPGPGSWGGINLQSGAFGVIDSATIEYAGGAFNTTGGTVANDGPAALSLSGGSSLTGGFGAGVGTATTQAYDPTTGQSTAAVPSTGARVMITNNNFTDNAGAGVAIDPDGLLAADPLTPLSSGNPFFRNNVLTGNAINGLLVRAGNTGGTNNPTGYSNLSNNSVWELTDITYVLEGTIVPSVNNQRGIGQGGAGAGPPAVGAIPTPSLTLTIQSQLGGTLLANGQTIPSPGQSVIVKLNGTGPGSATSGEDSLGLTGDSNAGAGFDFGEDNGDNPATDGATLEGRYSQLRILGIGGDQSTGQQRVPVIITSIHDATVGPTPRGVAQDQVITGDAQAPAPGDGGDIVFGANTLTTFNALDLREGSQINNADIRYITRIEMQGGGVINAIPSATPLTVGNYEQQMAGVLPALADGAANPNDGYVQDNAPHELTVSDSNFSYFSQVGILEQPGFGLIANDTRIVSNGEPNQLFIYNSTFSNMPVGVQNVNPPGTVPNANPSELLLLNNDFYQVPIGVGLSADTINPIHFVAMDNIFDFDTTAAIQDTGLDTGSELEYNIFYMDGAGGTAPIQDLAGGTLSAVNAQAIYLAPLFVSPTTGDFQLQPDSPAIDAARSELDLSNVPGGGEYGTLIPLDTQVLTGTTGGTRNSYTRLPEAEPGANGSTTGTEPSDVLTLPGYGPTEPSLRGFVDQFEAALPGTTDAYAGPASNAATFDFTPLSGARDQLGNLRVKDPNSPDVGAGTRPYFDIGAFEYIQVFPPHVISVTATVSNPANPGATSTVNLYQAGGTAGTNEQIQSIQVQFDAPINPSTFTDQSVLLEATGGTGVFTNPILYNLSGKLSYADVVQANGTTTHTLTINLGAAGLVLNSDEYRLILEGTGSTGIKSAQGNTPLDGQNVAADNPANPQLALPSGSGTAGATFAGTNFFDTFVVNSGAPSIVAGTFGIDPSSVTSTALYNVTKDTTPSFVGTVAVPQPNIESLAGLTVVLDISTLGNGVFNLLNAGTAVTNAQGQFVVTVGQDAAKTGLVTTTSLPDSIYNVGPDGLLGTKDDSGYTWARVRVIDPSGNVSDLPTDTAAQFAANNAIAAAVIDTSDPTITGFSPTPGTAIQPTNGSITFSFTTDKNIEPSTLNSNSILVTRAGPSGVLGGADQVSVPIVPSSITVQALGGSRLGPEQISFTVSGNLPSDLYNVTLVGSGADAITDYAGNPINGGANYSSNYVSTSTTQNILYVQAPNPLAPPVTSGGAGVVTATLGSISNPYTTIDAAIAAAAPGDTVGVLPGVYNENVVLKDYVDLVSADPSSTDTDLVQGNALQTVIRAPEPTLQTTTTVTTTTVPAATTGTGTGTTTTGTGTTGTTTGTTITTTKTTVPAAAGATVGTTTTTTTVANVTTVTTVATALSSAGSYSGDNVTIEAQNLPYVPGAQPIVSGFTITSPLEGTLVGNAAQGPVDPTTAAVEIANANVLLENNYIIDAGTGVNIIATPGSLILMPTLDSNVIAGNNTGVQITDENATSVPNPARINNNDFVYNSTGLLDSDLATSPELAEVGNNIFYENHDQTTERNGVGINENFANNMVVVNNLFYGNGQSDATAAFAGTNVGNGFNPTLVPDANGNFVGLPQFINPVDPRPGALGPAEFFLEANYDLQSTSTAIDAADEALAPATDLLGRGRVRIPGRGFPGTGPADIGAFEYDGTGGTALGGAFRVVSDSLSTTGSTTSSGSTIVAASVAPMAITMSFSQNVNPKTIAADDLTVYGDGVATTNGIRPTSVTMVNPHTVTFHLAGSYSSQGSVVVKLNPGAITSLSGTPIQGFSDLYRISTPASPTPTTTTTSQNHAPTTTTTTTTTPVSQNHAPTATTVSAPVVSGNQAASIIHSAAVVAAPISTPKGPLAVRKIPTLKKSKK